MATINCPYCSKLTDPNLDSCPHCGGYIKKKVGAVPKAAKKTKAHCPSCKGSVDEGDIICVACGTNLLTGQKITDAPRMDDSSAPGTSSGKIIMGFLGLCAIALVVVGVYFILNNPLKRAQKLIANAQYPEAQELLMEIVQKDPDNETAHVELGKLQRRATQYNDAAGSFKHALELNPANTDAGLFAVLSLQESQQPNVLDEQIALLEQVTKEAREHAQAWYLLGMAYGTRGDKDDVEQQITALEHAITLSPSMESAELGLGIAETLQGNYPAAERHLSMIFSPEYTGDAQASLGYIAEYEQKYNSSIDFFVTALSAGEFNIENQARVQLSKILIQTGDFNPAEQHLKIALQNDPRNALGRYLLGLAIQSQGRANEALAEYQILVRGSHGYEGEAAVQVASLELLLGNVEDAQRAISVARRAKISTPAYYTVQGRVYMANESSGQAYDAFTTAIRMDPTYASAYMERGLYHISEGSLNAGLNDLKRYLNLVGTDMKGTKVRDIRMLANQLYKTLGG